MIELCELTMRPPGPVDGARTLGDVMRRTVVGLALAFGGGAGISAAADGLNTGDLTIHVTGFAHARGHAVAIARALANDPPILVADEPAGNLDSQTTEVIQRLFKQRVDAGKTVIVVTHDKAASAGYDRIVTLKDGAVQSDHTHPAEEQGALP